MMTRKYIMDCILLLLFWCLILTNIPLNVKAAGEGYFTGNVIENIVDTDGDGYYNLLEIKVEIIVLTPGSFILWSDLYFESSYIDHADEYSYLDEGIQYITLKFSGRYIYNKGFTGNYTLSDIRLYRSWKLIDRIYKKDISYYDYRDFQPDPISNVSVVSEAIDLNNNGYYDILQFTVTFTDTMGREMYLYAVLYKGNTRITNIHPRVNTHPGTNTITINFEGYMIYQKYLNGPYYLDLLFRDEQYDTIHAEYHIGDTLPYNYTEFELPPIEYLSIDYDHGVDEDGDGKYEYLAVGFRIRVNQIHKFRIFANLYGDSRYMASSDATFTPENTGEQVLEVRWPNYKIYLAKVSATYFISDIYIYDYVLNRLLAWTSNNYYLSYYNYTDFMKPRIFFTGEYNDYPYDDPKDLDNYYDAIVITVGVNVSMDGNYRISAHIYWDINYICPIQTDVYLTSGTHDVELMVPYTALIGVNYHGNPGPYPYTLRYLQAYCYDDSTLYQRIYQSYTTSAYNLSEFEPPPAYLTKTFTDYATNTDNIPGYDRLLIDAGISVNDRGSYIIYGVLYTTDGDYVTHIYKDVNLSQARTSITLEFNVANYMWSTKYEGRFLLHKITIYKMDIGMIDQIEDAYITKWYSYSNFNPPDVFYTGSFKDYGVDEDNDGIYEYLLIMAEVSTLNTGIYEAYVEVYDYYWNYVGTISTIFEVTGTSGTMWIEFYLNSGAIVKNVNAFPIYLTDFMIYRDSIVINKYSDYYNTKWYKLTDFYSTGYDGNLSGVKVSIVPPWLATAVTFGQPTRIYLTVVNTLPRAATYEITISNPKAIGIIVKRTVDDLPLEDTNSNGIVDTGEIAPFNTMSITLEITLLENVDKGMNMDAYIYVEEYNNWTNWDYSKISIGIGYSPLTPYTPVTAGTSSSPGSEHTEDTSQSSITDATDSSNATATTTYTYGEEEVQVAEKKVSTVTYDNGNVICRVSYKGSGNLMIRYVAPPKGAGYANIGIGKYIEITAPDTMQIISVDLTVKYSEDVENRLDERQLRMYYWNEKDNKWVRIEDSWVDAQKNEVHATLNHLTIFSAFQRYAIEKVQNVPPITASAILVVFIIVIFMALVITYNKVAKKRYIGK